MLFRFLFLSCSLLGFLTGGAVMAMEDTDLKSMTITTKRKEDSPGKVDPIDFEKFSEHVQNLILQQVIYEQSLENQSPVNIAWVSRKWVVIFKEEIQTNKLFWKAWHGIMTPEHENIYQTFLNGKLIYRPDPKSDVGMIELPIKELLNPLGSSFDLSNCGDTAQHLSIATGYPKAQNSANAEKIEIWFVPRFLVDKEMAQLAQNHYMRSIVESWDAVKAPIGIFWTWGGWDVGDKMPYCSYLTKESIKDIGSEDLFIKQKSSLCTHLVTIGEIEARQGEFFHFVCKLK